jgi:hypothetical protein
MIHLEREFAGKRDTVFIMVIIYIVFHLPVINTCDHKHVGYGETRRVPDP